MRPAVATTALLITGVLLSPGAASGQGRGAARAGSGELKPFFDSRAGAAASAPSRTRATRSVSAGRIASARAVLRTRLGRSGVLDVNPITDTPRSLLKLEGALSSPSGAGRDAVARSFLRANAAALGLSTADVDALALAKRVDAPRGVTILRYRQSFRGIPTFDNGVRVALDRAGRVLGVTGSPQAGLSVASTAPKLDAAAAMRTLQRSVGVTRAMRVSGGPAGARRSTNFASGEQARLTLFGARSGPRLAWHLDFKASSSEHYDGVVDAQTGKLLYRGNRVKAYSAKVFDYYAGAPGTGGDPNRVQDLTGPGWLPVPSTTLSGPFSHAWSDVDDDNVADPAEEVGPAPGDFQFTFVPFTDNGPPRCMPTHTCSWDPVPVGDRGSWVTNRQHSTTEAFFLVSKFHDHLASAPIGFDEDSGAFQFSDPVNTQALDGADTAPGATPGPDADHVNNANMSTPPDGESPTLQLFLFDFSDGGLYFDYNGDDAGTVWHEYTHGLSNRLVTNDDGEGALGSAHAGAMGEAWSDWYAEDLLVREGFETDSPDVSGDIDIGEPADAVRHATRSEAIDCPVGQGSSDPDSACPGAAATGPGGYTLGDFGRIAGGPEVHADGEIWVQTLWDLRTQLVEELGSDTAGSTAAEALITMGMRLAAPEPSMLDMRNAILQADTASFGGAQHDVVWSAFARRGMGYFASAFDSSDTKPAEDFNVPPAADTPEGNLRGTVFDSQTGLPLAGAALRIGAATTGTGAATFTATTGADGTYAIDGITEGTYAKLAVRPSGGAYDSADVRNVVIHGGETVTKDVPLVRDWASQAGGGSIASTNDDTGEPVCGPTALIDDGAVGWSAFNPTGPSYPVELSGDAPTTTIQLPTAVDVSAIGIDPAATCSDGASATLKGYRLEVSPDGTTFRPFSEGEFTATQAGELNLLDATGDLGAGVEQVRLTMLSPQNDNVGFSGRNFIDATSLEVFGAVPNQLPAGNLAASPVNVAPAQTVSFDASSFTDPDSRITGYDWDFDGDGTVDRTTDGPRTDFAYGAVGAFAAKVAVKDFRGGAGNGSATITVTAPSAPPTPPATTPKPLPIITIARSGTRGRFTLRVTCAQRCVLSGKVTLKKSLARRLHRKRLTIRTVRRTITSTARQTIRVKLSKSLIKALKKRGLKSLKVSARFSATYADGRKKTTSRRLKVRR